MLIQMKLYLGIASITSDEGCPHAGRKRDDRRGFQG